MKKILPVVTVLILLLGSSFVIWHSVQKRSALNKDETLIVGTNAEYEPFSFIENNLIVGFDIDVITEVSKRLGKKIEFNDMPFDGLLPKTLFGEIQVIAAGLTATPDKSKRVFFTKPYLTADQLIVISLAQNPPVTSLKDLDEKHVVVNEGYTADLHMSTIPGPLVKRLATPSEGFLALTSGNAYAFVAAQSSVRPYFKKYGTEKFSIFVLDGIQDNYSFAVSKHYPELLEVVQQALNAMEQDGTLAQIKQKWNL